MCTILLLELLCVDHCESCHRKKPCVHCCHYCWHHQRHCHYCCRCWSCHSRCYHCLCHIFIVTVLAIAINVALSPLPLPPLLSHPMPPYCHWRHIPKWSTLFKKGSNKMAYSKMEFVVGRRLCICIITGPGPPPGSLFSAILATTTAIIVDTTSITRVSFFTAATTHCFLQWIPKRSTLFETGCVCAAAHNHHQGLFFQPFPPPLLP